MGAEIDAIEVRCSACGAPSPYHWVECAVAAKRAQEDRALRRREVEAQERLALATQLSVLREIRAAYAESVYVTDERIMATEQHAECLRRLNELTQPPAPKETP